MRRLTIAVHVLDRDDANQLAMALGSSPADGQTYRGDSYQDNQGRLYSAASLSVSDSFFNRAVAPLERPEWDVEDIIDMTAAARAQAKIVLWTGEPDAETGEVPPIPQAAPGQITAVVMESGLAALEAMGLTRIETDDVH